MRATASALHSMSALLVHPVCPVTATTTEALHYFLDIVYANFKITRTHMCRQIVSAGAHTAYTWGDIRVCSEVYATH